MDYRIIGRTGLQVSDICLGTLQFLWTTLEKLEELGKPRISTPAQMALAWLLTRDGVSSVIIGAKTIEQLADNLGGSGMRLSQDEPHALDKHSA